MNFLREFRDFMLKQNMLALALAVVIGTAAAKVISAIVEDLLMPILAYVLPQGDWRAAAYVLPNESKILYGDLFGRMVDFIVVAALVFALTRALMPKVVPPPTKQCPECLETVPLDAKRCRACTAAFVRAAA